MTRTDRATFTADRQAIREMLARWDAIVGQIRDPEERRRLGDAFLALVDTEFALRLALADEPSVYPTIAGVAFLQTNGAG